MNVGIVGCGRVTRLRHLPALHAVEGARLVALADVDAGRAEALAREHDVARSYGDARDLLADDAVEAVAVCVPAALHVQVAIAAIEAGEHVLVEKPLCLSLDEAERLQEAAAGSATTLMVAFNMRWHRLLRRARELVRGGVIGELEAVRTTYTSSFDYRPQANPWRFRRETGGGAVIEMGAHHLDMWRFLSGLEVEEVFASSRSGDADDETVVVTGVLEGGARATSLVSQRSTNANELEVFGSRGRLRVDCYRYDGLEVQLGRGFGGDVRHRARQLAAAVTGLPTHLREARGGGAYVLSYAAEWRHFLECAASGRPPEAGIEDGVRNVEIIVGAVESIGSGQPVRLAAVEAVSS